MPRVKSLFVVLLVMANAIGHAQGYSVSWVANTYGDNAHHVGSCARSMWVDTNGMIYTASLWDENAGGIGIYQNGQTLGSMASHGEVQGCSITGNATSIFAEEQGANGGQVGRYNRLTPVRELMFSVSATNGDSIPGLAISPVNGLLYASDNFGNRVRVFTANGVWQQDWTVASPGALAVDGSGNVWVAQMTNGTILEFNATGTALNTISMGVSNRPSALYFDAANAQLMVGDEGPEQNIKIYGNLGSTPILTGTFGEAGGYLSTAGNAIKGQTGGKRFTRIVGIGKDGAGNLYVLNNPWGGTWDLGRSGGTDLHCYNSSGSLTWTLQSLNFEGVGAADPGTDGMNLYSGEFLFTGSGGGGFIANTIDPFSYPGDARLDINSGDRGEDFGSVAWVGTNRILVACNQGADKMYSYYFNPVNGYIAIPGQSFGTTGALIRNGFQLEPTTGDIWVSFDKSGAISHYPLRGFNTNGQPIWGTPTTVPTPPTIMRLNRIEYVPSTDTMVLNGTNSDWTSMGSRVEVYHGWLAGNINNPNPIIALTRPQPKSMSAAGEYLFVGYYATNTIDVFSLTDGALVLTMKTNITVNYTGNDIDSMYGIKAYKKSNGQYLVTKDDYNASKIVLFTFTPAGLPVLTGIAPSSPITGSSGPQTLAIMGANFQAGCAVTLNNLDLGVSSSPAATFVSASNLAVNANFTTIPHNWSVQVTNSGASVSAPFKFAVQAPPQPRITNLKLDSSDAQLILTGTNGTAGLTYCVLASTNLSLPPANWIHLATNVFGPGGEISWTNAVAPVSPQSFYIIKP